MRAFRRIMDIVLLCIVIAYSGAHWPTSQGFARVGASFKAGYDRAIVAHQQTEK